MRKADYESLENGEGFSGSIAGLDGVWANAPALEACREELEEVLEDWLLVRLTQRLPIPPLDGIDLQVHSVA